MEDNLISPSRRPSPHIPDRPQPSCIVCTPSDVTRLHRSLFGHGSLRGSTVDTWQLLHFTFSRCASLYSLEYPCSVLQGQQDGLGCERSRGIDFHCLSYVHLKMLKLNCQQNGIWKSLLTYEGGIPPPQKNRIFP